LARQATLDGTGDSPSYAHSGLPGCDCAAERLERLGFRPSDLPVASVECDSDSCKTASQNSPAVHHASSTAGARWHPQNRHTLRNRLQLRLASERPLRSLPVIVRPLAPIRPSPPALEELADSAGARLKVGQRGWNFPHSAWCTGGIPGASVRTMGGCFA
jgi:hypothetical protein